MLNNNSYQLMELKLSDEQNYELHYIL